VGAKEFSIFVFLFSFLPLVSVPQGIKREKRRMKNEEGKGRRKKEKEEGRLLS
jgi:hypothetical protein